MMTSLTRAARRLAALLLALIAAPAFADEAPPPRWSIAIHGGAGTITREGTTPEKEAEYRAALSAALEAGSRVLRDGGTALDAVEAAIVLMEDDPHFNAGRGAVYTWQGTNELDASIMDGRTRAAGAATGLTRTRNPIRLARAVMERSRHVFLSGAGAEEFAREQGLEEVDPAWFATPERLRELEQLRAQQLSAGVVDYKYGTVGVVALDTSGHVAAGTSTGGMTGKRWGRIGDAPVIGAGTYADDRACAVSATGWGEFFIREGVAHEVCARLRFTDEGPQTAADTVIAEVAAMGGNGGVIVLTTDGQTVFSFNTPGMYRGRANSAGLNEVAIFAGE